ncbi:MAG TPA: DUF4032 domain-containing protein, partial [Ilumatobacteraceae bacterium]|nr:DUF4032 domain-containing protein [Ilumatobacteraceae bacterium]
LSDRFEAAIAAIPTELVGKLEPAELYHQMLEHRWYLSEREGHDVGFDEAVRRYVDEVLATAPAEQIILPNDTGTVPIVP